MPSSAPHDDALRLPPAAERTDLFRRLVALVNARGFSQLVLAPSISPTAEDFPDRWQGGPASARRVADRLLRYAGLEELSAQITLVDEGVGRPWDGGAHLTGIQDGQVSLAIERVRLEDPSGLVAALAREVARAYRLHHRLPSEAGEAHERDVDVTAIYLGFGLLTVPASARSKVGQRRRAATLERLGAVSPQGLSFVLAARALASATRPGEIAATERRLSVNPVAFFRAAVAALQSEPQPVRVRLGIPDPSSWPPAFDLTYLRGPLAAPGEDDPPSTGALVSGANDGRPVFRIESTMALRLGRGLTLPVLLLGGIMAGPLHAPITMGQVVVTALALGVAGLVVGRFIRDDRCSDPKCGARLSRGSEVCPRCRGSVRGTITHASERLAAEEALPSVGSLTGSAESPHGS